MEMNMFKEGPGPGRVQEREKSGIKDNRNLNSSFLLMTPLSPLVASRCPPNLASGKEQMTGTLGKDS